MHRHLAGLVAALALMTSSAIADGMNTRGSIRDSVQPFSWRGFYVGAHAGLATGNAQSDFTGSYFDYESEVVLADKFSLDQELNGALYGVQVGWLGQWGNVVAGIEGSYSRSSVQGTEAEWVQRDVNWVASVVGRAGLAYNRVLLYGLAGVAWADVDSTYFDYYGNQSRSNTHVGWTAGFGVEWALSDRVSTRIEYAHIDLGRETNTMTYLWDYEQVKDRVKLEIDTIRLGVNVKLGH